MALDDPSKASKLERLLRARERFRPLLEDSRLWENECEAAFSEFRVAVVHLRRDSDEIDALEGKDLVWRFLCKLSRERRPFWGRCEEVLRTLMQSDQWVKAFVQDASANLNDLPTNVIKEFGERVEEVGGVPQVHVRLAVIGCGAVAARHCASMARWNARAHSDFYRVVALCDADPSRVAALRELPEAAQLKLQDAAEVSTLEALLDRVDFDAAAFLSHHHREGALAELLARGKRVIAEPPLAPTPEAAARLARLSRQPPGAQRLLVAEGAEHWPGVLLAAERLAAGEAGEVVAAEGRGAASGREALEALGEGVGCTLAPGLRLVRALRRLAGPVERACGVRRTPAAAPPPAPPPDASPDASPSSPSSPAQIPSRSRRSALSTETFAACLFQHAGGVVSTLQLQSRGEPLPPARLPHLVVTGTQGQILVEDAAPDPGGAAPARPLDGDEGLWELFSRLLEPAARNAPGPPAAPEEAPPELLRNLDEHLADLAVVHALGRSFQTERFEAVEGLSAEA